MARSETIILTKASVLVTASLCPQSHALTRQTFPPYTHTRFSFRYCPSLFCATLPKRHLPRSAGRTVERYMPRAPKTTTCDLPECWPTLPLEAWKDTCCTLHMWTQIVGKVRLTLTPLVN